MMLTCMSCGQDRRKPAPPQCLHRANHRQAKADPSLSQADLEARGALAYAFRHASGNSFQISQETALRIADEMVEYLRRDGFALAALSPERERDKVFRGSRIPRSDALSGPEGDRQRMKDEMLQPAPAVTDEDLPASSYMRGMSALSTPEVSGGPERHADLESALYMVDSLKRELAVKRGEAGALWDGRTAKEAEMEALRAAPCSVKELDDGALWVEGRLENILTALAALWDAAPKPRCTCGGEVEAAIESVGADRRRGLEGGDSRCLTPLP